MLQGDGQRRFNRPPGALAAEGCDPTNPITAPAVVENAVNLTLPVLTWRRPAPDVCYTSDGGWGENMAAFLCRGDRDRHA